MPLLDFYGPDLPPIDPDHMIHFMAVQSAVWQEEAADLRAYLSGVGPGSMRRILADLFALSIPDAVAAARRDILAVHFCDHVEDDDGLHCDYCGVPL